jgi:hypothetical protein
MKELEQQIRNLSLRKPAETLDQRIFVSVRGFSDNDVRQMELSTDESKNDQSSASVSRESSQPLLHTAKATKRHRGLFSISLVGMVAALLIGMAIGNGLPSLSSRPASPLDRISNVRKIEPVISVGETESEASAYHPMMPDLPTRVREALQHGSTVGSQFVESTNQSAIAGAVLWERQNGEVFNVTTHVKDRRFDMCRDCHRVGG